MLTDSETKGKKKTFKYERDKYASILEEVRVDYSGHERLGYACPCLLLRSEKSRGEIYRLQNVLLTLHTHVLILFYYYRHFYEKPGEIHYVNNAVMLESKGSIPTANRIKVNAFRFFAIETIA